MLWILSMVILERNVNKIAEGYYNLIIKGKSQSVYVANAIKGNVNKNICEIPIMNLKFQTEGDIIDCIYKPTSNLNEFEVVIYYKK